MELPCVKIHCSEKCGTQALEIFTICPKSAIIF